MEFWLKTRKLALIFWSLNNVQVRVLVYYLKPERGGSEVGVHDVALLKKLAVLQQVLGGHLAQGPVVVLHDGVGEEVGAVPLSQQHLGPGARATVHCPLYSWRGANAWGKMGVSGHIWIRGLEQKSLLSVGV